MNQHIDDLFKEKLQNYESQPSQDLWNNIQKNPSWTRHMHRQNLRNLIIYTTLGIAAAGITTAIILNQHPTPTAPSTAEIAKVEETLQQATTTEEKTPALIANDLNVPTSEMSDINNTENSVNPSSTEVQPISTSTPNSENIILQNNTSTNNQSSNSNTPNSSLQTPNPSLLTPNSPTTATSSSSQGKPAPTKSAQTTTNTKPMTNSPSSSEPTTPTTVNTTSPFAIPNAFTPNGDGLNDIFAPQTERSISNYQIDIYTMGGQRVFSSKDLSYGWNGEYQGGLMTGGTYVYVIKYRDTDGTDRLEKGQLLLIR